MTEPWVLVHPYSKSPTGATLKAGQRVIGTALLTHYEGFEGRPCRALSFLPRLTQGLVALAGLRTLGFGRVAPLGLSLPSPARPKQGQQLGLSCTSVQLRGFASIADTECT